VEVGYYILDNNCKELDFSLWRKRTLSLACFFSSDFVFFFFMFGCVLFLKNLEENQANTETFYNI
jgi:hypothetical protein